MKPITILRGRAGRFAPRPSKELEAIGIRVTGSGAAAAAQLPPPAVLPAVGIPPEAADVLGSTAAVAAPPAAPTVVPVVPAAVPAAPVAGPVGAAAVD